MMIRVAILIVLFPLASSAFAAEFQWAGVGGTLDFGLQPHYGNKGVAATSNHPGPRSGAVSFTNKSGDLWMFGGYGCDNCGVNGRLNDLWKYDPVSKMWTWMSGSEHCNEPGNYGQRGVPTDTNMPGARSEAVGWSDSSGALWLFGGDTFISDGVIGYGNDLWRYDIKSGQWTWMKGSTVINQQGSYGELGKTAPTNTPGARADAMGWIDHSGILWLFGGELGSGEWLMNDLWKYDPATGNWTWVKGSSSPDQLGVYGTIGIPADENTPGSRKGAGCWVDTTGLLWMFGGFVNADYDDSFNDLWRYNPETSQWVWVKGSRIENNGRYGQRGIPSSDNIPPARSEMITWIDKTGTFWLFGGISDSGSYNDLWSYDLISGNWVWVSGSESTFELGNYGEQGIASQTNSPPNRSNAISWVSPTGSFYMYSGLYWRDYTHSVGHSLGGYVENQSMNDLWEFDPSSSTWTWIQGAPEDLTIVTQGCYGTKRVAAATNQPCARENAASWIDSSGALWLFGGFRYHVVNLYIQHYENLNDLWKYQPSTHTWTWMAGKNSFNSVGVYGELGKPEAANTPGARSGSATWCAADTLWLFGGFKTDYPLYPIGESKYFFYHNDLWKYSISTGQWTWVKGSSESGSLAGNYGTIGVEAPSNTPGSRGCPATWIDAGGALWMFGGENGQKYDSYLNDLWKFNPATSNWVWVGGSSNPNDDGVYGTRGIPDPNNIPRARSSAVSWKDASGNFWLFAGRDDWAILSDLWKYTPSTGMWTWMKGEAFNQPAVYGQKGVPNPANTPGGRISAVGWVDQSGSLWMMGGEGFDSTDTYGDLNDVWRYDPGTGNWTWVAGSNLRRQKGVYSSLGYYSSAYHPGGRHAAIAWYDNLRSAVWIFGGYGHECGPGKGYLNDLWRGGPFLPTGCRPIWEIYQ